MASVHATPALDELPETVRSRLDIGFGGRADWVSAPAEYTEHALRIAGHPVMEDWEAGYMARLAEVACSAGPRVLELGYGMGISARAIQGQPGPRRHVVVECHPEVAARGLAEQRAAIADRRLHLFQGFWEDVSPLLGDASFDGILFDTYPLEGEDVHRNHFAFFAEAHRLLRPGGILTYYSDEAEDLAPDHRAALGAAGFTDVAVERCPVEPPADCEYWQASTLVVPLVRR